MQGHLEIKMKWKREMHVQGHEDQLDSDKKWTSWHGYYVTRVTIKIPTITILM